MPLITNRYQMLCQFSINRLESFFNGIIRCFSSEIRRVSLKIDICIFYATLGNEI